MFDIGAAELLVIVVVAIIVIGPKDMPRAMRTAGRWIGKIRRMSSHFRAGVDEMVRQAEIQDMEEKWAARNKEIMAKYPTGNDAAGGAPDNLVPPQMEPLDPADADTAAEAAIKRAAPVKAAEHSPSGTDQPGLPLDPPPPPKDA
ncbi:Sec-independent protein translocase protein TatB [Qipengyuania sp. 6B39]|uniref:Sec-independent protein translocase protein TatB n=1 Tax=Qipengyuania proteolytica TaxID=2867239 RepID=UPI001C8AE8BE|nr:Sec-independent protein translocase protein TatB [Qipengyuania proteolytica]MBX7496670.1 Sec-independent protein translocase protein TatB [Qipengyuania proteolytica]